MQYQILKHRCENTGGGCMVGFDTVWLPEEEKTIFVHTNEMGCSFWNVDVYTYDLDDVEPFGWLEIDDASLAKHKYFDLLRECIRLYVMDTGELALPYDVLPDEAKAQITDDYRRWNEEVDGGSYVLKRDGKTVALSDCYEPPVEHISTDSYNSAIHTLYQFRAAFNALEIVWSNPTIGKILDALVNEYPFHLSFDEHVNAVDAWVDAAVKEFARLLRGEVYGAHMEGTD